jgi:bifunctional oligoribonuclease and PAP phosphatase NrnA
MPARLNVVRAGLNPSRSSLENCSVKKMVLLLSMRRDSFKKLAEAVKKSKRIVIVTHLNPDGDAMGSSLALSLFLQKLNKEVKVIVPNAFPQFLDWMPDSKKVLIYQHKEKKVESLVAKSDLLFVLDFNSFKRIEKLGDHLKEQKHLTTIVIDHHQQPDNIAKYYLSDVTASSTCELIYDLIKGTGNIKKLDKKIAACLYTGLMTDTGSFRFPSVNEKTHLIIADLLKTGMKHEEIHSAVYDTYSRDRMRLLGHALNKIQVLPDNKTAYIALSEQELKEFNYQKGDTEGMVNYPFGIKGINFCVLFAEWDGMIKISFRSKGKIDVNKFARAHFNGGGHVNAAGGRSNESLQATVEKFVNLVGSGQ